MSIPASQRSKLLLFSADNIPLNARGEVVADIYVELPRNERFVRYVCGGESISEKNLRTIAKLRNPNVFMVREEIVIAGALPRTSSASILSAQSMEAMSEDFFSSSRPLRENEKFSLRKGIVPVDSELSFAASSHLPEGEEASRHNRAGALETSGGAHRQQLNKEDFNDSRQSASETDLAASMVTQFGVDNAEFLKTPIAQELKRIFGQLIIPVPGQINLEDSPISELTDLLVKVIAPEVESLRNYLKAIPQYILIMNDSAAITAIATLFAIARGQTSRSIFKDLSYACLFMDISLTDFEADSWRTYYLDPESLSNEDKKKIYSHPRRSAELVQQRFRNLPDIVNQLILGHHELFNGKGFPRRLRSEMLAPLSRILAFATDVFEFMKRQHLRKRHCTLAQAVNHYLNEPVAPHMRRHGLTLCREIAEYINAP